jgi:hypothetical protein
MRMNTKKRMRTSIKRLQSSIDFVHKKFFIVYHLKTKVVSFIF